ncbi:hypothetical protein M406DRAFT_257892 [Cryphonectria parasitica EP155]|uniref:DUF7598 domain-containing protein n=1 Tax=Cryphonectria parasitica (strain ATCC 38755 / EP155) TaxID=660469 RepID=A0A9P4Y3G2_CRYP1|nr:uncharacterized protein M406DRAFT_257892 [Cryphonectria parasitica EP155]KAF3765809.1 hypothetical protein M406DRAFT_257892 [Cryphonectria parasitica EP155]
MFSMSENSSLLGPAWYILQVLRACNILALLSVAMSSMIMVVKTNIVTSFFVFQAISHTITAGVAMMLLISELPQPAVVNDFYRRNWPTFSTVDASNRGHSLAWLGVWMIAMGIWVMGSLNAADLINDLSFPLWRLTLASGILAFVFGLFNLIVSLIFRSSTHNITVRMIREHGANVYNVRMTSAPYDIDAATMNSGGSDRSNSIRREKQFNFHHPFPAAVNPQNRFSRLFAKDKKPQISGPIINHPTAEPDLESGHHQYASRPQTSERESWEGQDRASPIVPGVQRPPTALHPAYTGGRSSVYSEASHLNRF